MANWRQTWKQVTRCDRDQPIKAKRNERQTGDCIFKKNEETSKMKVVLKKHDMVN